MVRHARSDGHARQYPSNDFTVKQSLFWEIISNWLEIQRDRALA
jgi:hypothetical protein